MNFYKIIFFLKRTNICFRDRFLDILNTGYFGILFIKKTGKNEFNEIIVFSKIYIYL